MSALNLKGARRLAGLMLGVLALAAQGSSGLLARIEYSSVLPGSGHSWGFAALQPGSSRLWIARRENGLTVFDTSTRHALRNIDGSTGANSVAFAPAADRAYLANTDGSVSIVRLSDQRLLRRLAVSDANLNSAMLEPLSGKVWLTSGRRAGHSTLYLLDPASDSIVAQRDVEVKKIDPPLALGDGTVLLPARDEGQVLRLNGTTLAQQSAWRYPDCQQPSALAADFAQRRLFIACRGERPVLVVADLDSGAQVASLPVGHAVNALAYDAARKLVLAPSGADASLALLRQDDADHYTPLGQLATRSWAHNMAYDTRSGTAWLLAMDVTQPAAPAGGGKRDPVFHPDTFTVLGVRIE
jgi:DNA-binding beta-propeller fold protein YncE